MRNMQAFQTMSSFFLRSTQSPVQLKILEAILNVFASNHANFPTLQHLHTLAHFIENLARFALEVQDAVLRMLVFVGTVGGCIPFQELVGLSCLLDARPHMNIFVLLFQTVTKLVNYEAKYRKILQETGLLDVLINHMKKYACDLPQGSEQEACYTVVMDTLAVLLERMPENAGIFRTSYGNNNFIFLLNYSSTFSLLCYHNRESLFRFVYFPSILHSALTRMQGVHCQCSQC